MYMPPKFMTLDVLTAVLAEFEWPAPYTLESWRLGAIGVVFPRCTLAFVEGFESEMQAKFLPRDTSLDNPVTLYEVLLSRGGPDTPGLIDEDEPSASLRKVQNQLRDLCTIVLYHFRDSLLGDFGWVCTYRQYLARPGA